MVEKSKVNAPQMCECCGRPEENPDVNANEDYLCEPCLVYVLAVEEYSCRYSSKLI